ncbi:ADP-ribosylglycohydrolase family protein [Streptomyces sp. NPDC048512]|uniref:ADP-ribosylglycohydrolase family protein n=1 Tax=unclassified Streptomyces TaxID=2593676 RepID=UPI0009BF4515|nr:ADP-ribosylglycohydrolase family protein [Streptomyces sp. M41(2017)]OQQ19904.1 ribosylglycohydrolase [Streptomyces sp. M41(2017)]
MARSPAPHPELDARATDRAAGVLLGAAAGDALGVPYEFKATLRADQQPMMIGGGLGPYEPGEYSDDTQMQVCIAQVAATGADLRDPEAQDEIAANFQAWLGEGASDVGNQTSMILSIAAREPGSAGTAMRKAAHEYTAGNARSAGNGSLMRTGIVALAHLGDPVAMAEAAITVSALTHPDPECADACVLWCSGIRTAVLDGTFDGVRAGLDLLPVERRGTWAERLDEAEAHPPRRFNNNGWVVHALQAAWSAITRTAVPELRPAEGSFPAQHLKLALEAAVRAGTDTDTVAAIAGALLGARWGSSAVPLEWQRAVTGWPGMKGADLVRLALLTARGGSDDAAGWPSTPQMPSSHPGFAIPHPHDPGVVLGSLTTAQSVKPLPVDAVVSLCRMGTGPVLHGSDVEHVRVWLVDSQGDNANLHYVLDQAAREVLRLRQEGKRVLLHCYAGQSRTPAVGAAYSNLAFGLDPRTALKELRTALVNGWHLSEHPELQNAVYELATPTSPGGKTTGAVSRTDQAHDVTAGTTDDETGGPRDDATPEQDSLLSMEPEDHDAGRTPREFMKEKHAVSRVRGLLLGLAIGDTLGRAKGKLPADGPLLAGVSTQLACFTTEGTIRALVRGDHKGICHPPGVVWHAYRRWAALQGLEAERSRSAGRWPDGWLAQVPALTERRGSAPATVTALAGSAHGQVKTPTTSRGCHALTRTLPVAVLSAAYGSEPAVDAARDIASLTHGDPAAHTATAQAVVLAQHCLTDLTEAKASSGGRTQVRQALAEGLRALRGIDRAYASEGLDRLGQALEMAIAHPADAERLAKLAPDATAPSALLGGMYAAASFPERDQVADALSFAARAPDADSVACVAGALLGAAHGAEALPVDLVSRHELAWVLDTLARDLTAQLADLPGGTEYTSGWDPTWLDRYPGW